MKRTLGSPFFRLFIKAFSLTFYRRIVTDEVLFAKKPIDNENLHHTAFPANTQTFQQDAEDRQMVMDAALRSIAL